MAEQKPSTSRASSVSNGGGSRSDAAQISLLTLVALIRDTATVMRTSPAFADLLSQTLRGSAAAASSSKKVTVTQDTLASRLDRLERVGLDTLTLVQEGFALLATEEREALNELASFLALQALGVDELVIRVGGLCVEYEAVAETHDNALNNQSPGDLSLHPDERVASSFNVTLDHLRELGGEIGLFAARLEELESVDIDDATQLATIATTLENARTAIRHLELAESLAAQAERKWFARLAAQNGEAPPLEETLLTRPKSKQLTNGHIAQLNGDATEAT